MEGQPHPLTPPHIRWYYNTMIKRRAKSREGMIVMTVAFPPEMHRQLAIAALDDKASINELVREAVRQYLDSQRKRSRGRRALS